MPTYTVRPRKNGRPQSNEPGLSFPPILRNTLFPDPIRSTKFPISNDTDPDGEPETPLTVAEKLFVDEGQYQKEYGPEQSGKLAGGEPKKSPLEPVSAKLV